MDYTGLESRSLDLGNLFTLLYTNKQQICITNNLYCNWVIVMIIKHKD